MYNFPVNQWDMNTFLLIQAKHSCFLQRLKKQICTCKFGATWERQTRTPDETPVLNFSYPGEMKASFKSWLWDLSMSLMDQPKIPLQTTSESQGSWFFWLERREFRRGYGGTEGNCLSKTKSKQVNKWTYSLNQSSTQTMTLRKGELQKQDSTSTPTLASADMGVERLAVLMGSSNLGQTCGTQRAVSWLLGG